MQRGTNEVISTKPSAPDKARALHERCVQHALAAAASQGRQRVTHGDRRGTDDSSVRRTLVLAGDMLIAEIETKAVVNEHAHSDDAALEYRVFFNAPDLFP